jgi:hypothetical protein
MLLVLEDAMLVFNIIQGECEADLLRSRQY